MKSGTNSKYTKKGYITSSSGLTVKNIEPTSAGKYYVKLKDAAGNVSSAKTVTSSYATSSSSDSSDSSSSSSESSSSSDSLVSGDFKQKIGTGSATATVATTYTMSEGDTAYVGLASVAHDGRTVSTIANIASSTTFKWTSSNTSVATVSSSSGKGLRSITVTAKKAGTATITCTAGSLSYSWKITVKALESEYNYEITVLNSSNYKMYASAVSRNRTVVIYYIKTDNPDKSTLSLNLTSDAANNGSSYDDITYTTSYTSSISPVSGGYVSCVVYKTTGTKTFSVTEQIDSTHSVVVASAPTVKLYDGDAAEEEWYEDVLASVTDSSMTSKEKMQALQKYVLSNFKYWTTDSSSNLIYLTTNEGVWFETQMIDCVGATRIMRYFADMLGLENTSASNSAGHVWAVITDDVSGSTYKVDASPDATNVVTSWTMVIE
ncbi:MAG: Ig-like domain-containing protein [Lachnospiraceae bacterium]|nr:Ig-like domain-containing protein [Lachnospiraceae bacterium]